jgi:hypothetical protein
VMAALGHDRGARVTSPQEARRQSHRQAAFAQIEFATDSPLEGDGFELPVPRERRYRDLTFCASIYVQKDQSDGGARKAKAKRGQHDTPVKAVREPADWNLEREPTKHRHQHGHCDRLARDAFVLHPGRNERVE